MTLLLVVSCLTAWVTLYAVLCVVNPHRRYEWHCRTVTVIHAILISFLAAWCSFAQGPWPFTDAGGANTPLQHITTSICLGYFIFDFSWCLYFRTEGAAMLLHHALSIVGLSITLLAGKYGTELVATICGAEITNPLLQLRWFLRETGRYDSILGEVVDVAFMLSFFAMRMGVGSFLLYYYFQQPTDLLGRFGGVCIYLIGWVFMVAMIQYAIKKYKKKWRAWKKHKSESLNGDVKQYHQGEGESEVTRTKGSKVTRTNGSEVIMSGVKDFPSQGELNKPTSYLRVGKHSPMDGADVNGVINGQLSCLVSESGKKNL